MKPYGLSNKSRANDWNSKKCECPRCNRFARKVVKARERRNNKQLKIKNDE